MLTLRLISPLALIVWLTPSTLAQSPTYDIPETQRLVEQMIDAHGGMAAWEAISAFQFTTAMHLASLPIGEGRTYHHNLRYYTVTLDPHTSRGYVEFPWDEREGSTIGFDGTTLWALPYTLDPVYNDGARQLMYYHYGMLALPWMTQLAHVRLSRKPQASLPTHDGSFHVVAMQFNPPGKTHEGGFELYIDPETFLIRGFTQTTSYPLLPGDVLPSPFNATSFPGMYRVIDAYATTNGLTLPRTYTTVGQSEEGLTVFGAHMILEVNLNGTLDSTKLQMPAGAEAVYTRPR